MDFNSVAGSLLGAVLVLMIFRTKEDEYLLEASTDVRCFFSPVISVGLATSTFSSWYRHFTIPRFTD